MLRTSELHKPLHKVRSQGNENKRVQKCKSLPVQNTGDLHGDSNIKRNPCTSEVSLKEVKDIVKATRSSSTPGPSGIPSKVNKQCVSLLV